MILSYNILIEFYVMINKLKVEFYIYLYQNTSNNVFYRYRDFWAGVDKEPIPILLFFGVD